MASSAYTDENGELVVNPTTYTPVFANGNLSGAVFQVIAAEDIVTLDGTVHANAGDVVAEITTDENGYAETEPLYLGKYEVREIKAPEGYVLNNEPKDVELTYAGLITVEISKRDLYGNELEGAEIVLENADGETVDKWTSDGKNHIVSKLGTGEYVLKEIAAHTFSFKIIQIFTFKVPIF